MKPSAASPPTPCCCIRSGCPAPTRRKVPIDRLAGIRISANGAPVTWKRDPVEVFAFRLHLKPGTHAIDIDFDYLAPTSPKVGALEIKP